MKKNCFQLDKKRSGGFTILESAMVLLVGGLIMIGGFGIYKLYIQTQYNIVNNQRIATINQAIQAFVNDSTKSPNHLLPCPANPMDPPQSATFGLQDTGIAGKGCGDPKPNGLGISYDGILWQGAVPVRTLGLDDSYINDAFGNRFFYVVTKNLAMKTAVGTFPPDLSQPSISAGPPYTITYPFPDMSQGKIKIATALANPVIATVPYIVISAGIAGTGAWPAGGMAQRPCLGSPIDMNNCSPVTSLDKYIAAPYGS